jgi:hypothetical protein
MVEREKESGRNKNSRKRNGLKGSEVRPERGESKHKSSKQLREEKGDAQEELTLSEIDELALNMAWDDIRSEPVNPDKNDAN